MERPDLSMGTRHALTCRLTCAWSDALHDLGCFPASFELCSPFLGETGLVSPLSASEAELEGRSTFAVLLGLVEPRNNSWAAIPEVHTPQESF